MARQKRRRTTRSRSHSPAARRRRTLGDIVRVKDGVMDPDDDGDGMGGWSGTSIAFETWEQTPRALSAWDASTQRGRLAPAGRRRAASPGLAVAQMWLQLSDCARVAGGTGAPRSEVQPRAQGGEPSVASWTPPSCGHRYPEVLRLRDEGRADGTVVRMPDCRHCGRAESPCPARMLAAEWRRALEATGSVAGMAEDEIAAVRQRAERRQRRRDRPRPWWQWGRREVVRPGASLGLRTRGPGPLSSRSGGDNTMVSPLFYSPLALLARAWLVLLLHLPWPQRSAATITAPATPIKPTPKRSNEPTPLAGLPTPPPGALCARETAHLQPPPPVPPAPIPPTPRRPRTVDTAQPVWPHRGWRYRGWRGRGTVRATGQPRGGRWRQWQWTSCDGYFLETHGTIVPGKQAAVERIVHGLACLAEGLGIRATARVFAVEANTVRHWLVAAAEQLRAVSASCLCDLHVEPWQLDAVYAVRRDLKAGAISEAEAMERLARSPYWGWTAMAPQSTWLLVIEVGTRTMAMAQRVVHPVVQRVALGCVPLFLTDGFRESMTA